MNFFKEQARAQKNTKLLILLMCLAVLSLIAITVLAITAFFFFNHDSNDWFYFDESMQNMHPFIAYLSYFFYNGYLFMIAIGVIAVVAIGSGFKLLQLRKGGEYVAQGLGAVEIHPAATKSDEKRLLNVVEEIAIASGTPMPKVYLLEDESINAFAAGNSTKDAVIGVTRGCMEKLNRSEIQGVIAHEFSHIHHGDMRINMRLLSVLHGILVIGLIGEAIIRSMGSNKHRRSSSSSSDKKEGGGGLFIALGLAFLVIGYSGIFFGKIIKAAVSRQREYLADASAVQYTRNPLGIAGALHQIREGAGSKISSAKASEFSHFYFAKGIGSLFSTHPPVDDRILKIMPGGFTPSQRSKKDVAEPPKPKASQAQKAAIVETIVSAAVVSASIDQMGDISEEQIEKASEIVDDIPAILKEACQSAFEARALIYCLLFDRGDNEVLKAQFDLLRKSAHPQTYNSVIRLHRKVEDLPRRHFLPLIQLSAPALRDMSLKQAEVFVKNVKKLCSEDNEISAMEWSIGRIVFSLFETSTPSDNTSIDKLQGDAAKILSYVASSCSKDGLAAFRKGFNTVWPNTDADQHFHSAVTIAMLDKSASSLRALKVLQKPRFLKGLAATIEQDGQIKDSEKELFRAMAMILDCPAGLI